MKFPRSVHDVSMNSNLRLECLASCDRKCSTDLKISPMTPNQHDNLPLILTLTMPYLNLRDLLRLSWTNRHLRDQVTEYLHPLRSRIPWRIAVDYSRDFCKVYVTYGWTNFEDMEVTSEASDYKYAVESVIWHGSGGANGTIIWETLLSGQEIVVNLDPLTMHPYGLNQEKWGIATRIHLGHGTMDNYHPRAPDRERSILTYCDDSVSRYCALKFQSISKETRRAQKFTHKGRKKSKRGRIPLIQ
jgi:hypothetical protein